MSSRRNDTESFQRREARGLTATGKKSRGLGKGHKFNKTTAGRRKTWKRHNTEQVKPITIPRRNTTNFVAEAIGVIVRLYLYLNNPALTGQNDKLGERTLLSLKKSFRYQCLMRYC